MVTFTQRSIDVPVVTKTLSYVDFITVTAWIKVDKLPDTPSTCPFVVSFLPPGISSHCNDVSITMPIFSSGLLGYTYPAEKLNLVRKFISDKVGRRFFFAITTVKFYNKIRSV